MKPRPKKVDHEPLVSARGAIEAVFVVQRDVKPQTPEWYALNRVLHGLWALPTRKAARG